MESLLPHLASVIGHYNSLQGDDIEKEKLAPTRTSKTVLESQTHVQNHIFRLIAAVQQWKGQVMRPPWRTRFELNGHELTMIEYPPRRLA